MKNMAYLSFRSDTYSAGGVRKIYHKDNWLVAAKRSLGCRSPKVFDCSHTDRGRELGLDRCETTLFYRVLP